jgi:hypothetical protein
VTLISDLGSLLYIDDSLIANTTGASQPLAGKCCSTHNGTHKVGT